MKEFIKNIVPKIKAYGFKLDKLSRIYNQPWVLINELEDFVKLIFQSSGNLIVSKNGNVSNGKWELISSANSILLEINGDKKLYNHEFIDEGIMILKLDGLSNDLFVLANQNLIEDLDVERYLNIKYGKVNSEREEYSKGKIATFQKQLELETGDVLQFVNGMGWGGKVRINNKMPQNGFYRQKKSDNVFEIEDGTLKMEFYIEQLIQEDGRTLEVYASRQNGINSGCLAFMNGFPAPSGKYKKGWFSNIEILNGKVK